MNPLRRLVMSAIAVIVAASSLPMQAQTSALQEKLVAQYTLTKATADRTDIVTAGAVVVLQKDSVLMDTTTSTVPMANTYKDGKLSHGVGDVLSNGLFKKFNHFSSHNVDTRTFVTGEKFWVTKISVQDEGVVFELFSDPISDIRYYADLKFPFPKGTTPDPDKMLSTVGEVLKVQPADDSGGDNKAAAPAAKGGAAAPATSAAAAPASSAAAAPMAPIAPPPPPADAPPAQPPTVALGQTKDQVIAILGQPKTVAHLGSKEIDYYPDFKVTFTGGKVTNVQ